MVRLCHWISKKMGTNGLTTLGGNSSIIFLVSDVSFASCILKAEYAFSRNFPVRMSLRQHAMMPKGAERFAAANAGQQPAVTMMPGRDNDTSVIRGPAIMKAGRVKPYEAASLAVPVRYPILPGGSGINTEEPYRS